MASLLAGRVSGELKPAACNMPPKTSDGMNKAAKYDFSICSHVCFWMYSKLPRSLKTSTCSVFTLISWEDPRNF